jgi:predicted alpha/beta-fold hydrolase
MESPIESESGRRSGRWGRFAPHRFTPPAPPAERYRLELSDGDFLDLDIREPAGEAPPRGYCVLVHGLEGSSNSPYILGTAGSLYRRGIVSVALNQRGCSGVPNRFARSYHSSWTDDALAVIRFAAARCAGLPGAAIGFSLGANQVLTTLALREGELPASLLGGVAVSAPFNLADTARAIDSPKNLIYRLNFLKTLVSKALAKARRFPESFDRRAILLRVRTVRAFDDIVTGPIHGFAGASDYYTRSCTIQHLPAIRRPTLLVSATDDPLIPGRNIPQGVIRRNDALTLIETDRGGHVGFMAGSLRRPRFFAEHEAVRFVQALISSA